MKKIFFLIITVASFECIFPQNFGVYGSLNYIGVNFNPSYSYKSQYELSADNFTTNYAALPSIGLTLHTSIISLTSIINRFVLSKIFKKLDGTIDYNPFIFGIGIANRGFSAEWNYNDNTAEHSNIIQTDSHIYSEIWTTISLLKIEPSFGDINLLVGGSVGIPLSAMSSQIKSKREIKYDSIISEYEIDINCINDDDEYCVEESLNNDYGISFGVSFNFLSSMILSGGYYMGLEDIDNNHILGFKKSDDDKSSMKWNSYYLQIIHRFK